MPASQRKMYVERALRLFTLSCDEHHDGKGCGMVAHILESDLLGPPDPKAARAYIEKGCRYDKRVCDW